MKGTKIRFVFLFLIIFVLILILKVFKDNIITDSDNEKLNYNIIIINKSKSPVFFRGNSGLFSCGIYDDEKVYYVTLNPNSNPNHFEKYIPFVPYFNIETEIGINTKKVFRVRGDVNNKNFLYEADEERGIAESQHPELCSDIHFILFFTRNPYKLNSYPEYIEIMKKDGYAVLGNRIKNDFYFTITDTEIQVNDDTINDLLLFIHKYLYPSKVTFKTTWNAKVVQILRKLGGCNDA